MIDNLLNKYIEKGNQLQKSILIKNYKELYKLEILKPGLDLILSEAEIGNITFELKIVDDLVQLRGCCLTHEKHIYHKVFRRFVKTFKHKILLQKLNVGVLMHEIAHALEKQGRINLSDGFDQAMMEDLKTIATASHTVRYAIDKIMYKDLKLYPENQQSSELFARLFQMFAMSKEVGHFDESFNFIIKIVENFLKIVLCGLKKSLIRQYKQEYLNIYLSKRKKLNLIKLIPNSLVNFQPIQRKKLGAKGQLQK